jgi:two-component system cell cycle sensor histidine kinase/response regulator CckA
VTVDIPGIGAQGLAILDNAPVLLDYQDTDHRIQWANKAYCDAVGQPLADIVGRRCYEVRGTEDECRGCPVDEAIRTGRRCQAELLPSNQPVWPYSELGWLSQAAPLRDEAGEIVGVIEVIGDITSYVRRTQRQEQVAGALLRLFDYSAEHSSQELLREILDEAEKLTDSRIGFYHYVEEDQLTLSLQMWSTRTEQVCSVPDVGTRYPISEAGVWVDCVRERRPVIHNDYARLGHRKGLPEGHAPVVRELVIPVIRGGNLVAILGVGNKPTDYDQQDVAVVGQLADLAWEAVGRKKAEEHSSELQLRYEQSQKMESIGRLAGGVAHDFNNMLSVILGQVDLALGDLDPRDTLHGSLQEVRRAAQRSADLTRQLLGFARQQPIRPRILDLNETVADMLKMLRRLIGEDINLEWRPSAEPLPVRIDPAQVDQILANLCVNARDAVSGGGTVTIATGQEELSAADCAEDPQVRPGCYAVLTVEDDGCGLDAETVGAIFEPFFTTKSKGEGTGLGLSTVYGIVRQNDGFIDVESTPGVGSIFRICLPRHDEPVPVRPPVAEPAREPGQGQQILLVEDESMILNYESELLRRLGYAVLPALTPAAALELAGRHAAEIDLLITDVVMPGMDGPELATRMREQVPGLPILFISGYTAQSFATGHDHFEGCRFLPKPFSASDLAAKVRELLREHGRARP